MLFTAVYSCFLCRSTMVANICLGILFSTHGLRRKKSLELSWLQVTLQQTIEYSNYTKISSTVQSNNIPVPIMQTLHVSIKNVFEHVFYTCQNSSIFLHYMGWTCRGSIKGGTCNSTKYSVPPIVSGPPDFWF